MNEDYVFENSGSIRILISQGQSSKICIKRKTPAEESLIFALEEQNDEIASLKENLEEKIYFQKSEILQAIEKNKEEIENKINEISNNFLIEAKSYSHIKELEVLQAIDNLFQTIKLNEENINKLESNISELSNATQLNKNKINESYALLLEDTKLLMEKVFLDMEKIKSDFKSLQESNFDEFKKHESIVYNQVKKEISSSLNEFTKEELKGLKKILKEIKSGLNVEIQVRRREDAQIKALLKRLLFKYENLEDYIAGSNIDFEENVISQLRKEMRAQDDLLGRTHLENMVRISMLKDRVINKLG